MAKQTNSMFSAGGLIARGVGSASAKSTIAASNEKSSSSSRTSTAKVGAMAAQPIVAKTKMASLVHTAVASKITPAVIAVDPSILINALEKTATQLANGAIQQLKAINAAVLAEAINTVKNQGISTERLMNYLERRVKIGEVLNEMAKDWDGDTQTDFAQALNMEPKKLEVMDSIVSLAILNDPDLEDDLRIENMDDGDDAALLENRRIVWQYPPPGTPLDPPYLVLVAVEHQDLTEAQETIDDIFEQLTTQDGFKVPRLSKPARRLPVARPGTPMTYKTPIKTIRR